MVSVRSARVEALAVLLLLAVGAALWVQRLGINDLEDTVSNEVLFSREPLGTILFRMKWPDQSPVYFVVLHFWRGFGESPFAVRFLNLVVYVLALIGFWRLARTLCGTRVALVALLLAVVSPLSFWIVRHGRMYTFVLLFTVLSLLLLARRGQRRAVALFVVASLLNVYTHFIGFLVAAILFLLWFADSVREARADGARWHARLRTPLAALLVFLAAASPQIPRLVALLRQPPAPGALSLPGLGEGFLEQTGWFLFAQAGWGTLLPWASRLRGALYGAVAVLSILGIACSPRRVSVALLAWIVPTLAAFGLLAPAHDLRGRYLVVLAPAFWLAVAQGAAGPIERVARTDAMRRLYGLLRGGMLLLLLALAGWLSVQKVPEGYAQWTKLMRGVARLRRPGTVVYMGPGAWTGIPRLVVDQEGLDPALAQIEPLSIATGRSFLREMREGREFVFLNPYHGEGHVEKRRAAALERAGYRRTVLQVHGVTATLLTREPPGPFVLERPVGPGIDAAVAWARERLRDPHRPAEPRAHLGRLLVARLGAAGNARESVFFMSQRGEDGTWRVGAETWDTLSEADTQVGGERRRALCMHAVREPLLVGMPDVAVGARLRLAAGVPDHHEPLNGVAWVEVYVDGVRVARVETRAGRWSEADADTTRLLGRRDVVLLAGADEGPVALCFRVD